MEMPRRRRLYEIHEKNRHGKYIWYFRRPGQKRVRLPGAYNSPEYIAAYDRAFAGKLEVQPVANTKTGTVAWLVDQYRQSTHYAGLKASTQKDRDHILRRFVALSGEVQFAKIQAHHLSAGMDAKADTPFAANNALVGLRGLFGWAVKRKHITINPTIGVDKIKAKSKGFHSWTVDEVEQFRTFHPIGTRARLAFDLFLFCGLRVSDVYRAGPKHVQDGLIEMFTTKTDTPVYLMIWPELQASIDATETGETFVLSSKGAPFGSAKTFGQWFGEECDKAGLPRHCRAHGLRKAGATIAANDGATPHELCAMFGWERTSTAEIYTRQADRKRLAIRASERIAYSRTAFNGAAKSPEKPTETVT
jgi:integrase